MEFEWDEKKKANNVIRHGVTFEEAATVFICDPQAATVDDPNHSERESRFITVGYSARQRLLFITHADRGANIRIISARLATPGERKRHEKAP